MGGTNYTYFTETMPDIKKKLILFLSLMIRFAHIMLIRIGQLFIKYEEVKVIRIPGP